MIALRGDGTVYRRSDNSWAAEQRYERADGTICKKSFRAKTKKKVVEKLSRYRKRCLIEMGEEVVSNVTVGEYIINWLENVKSVELKKTSYSRLSTTVYTHIVAKIGDLKFATLTASDLQSLLINDMLESGYYVKNGGQLKHREYSYSTVKKVYDAMNACYKYALRNLEVKYNPMVAVVMPSESKFKTKQARALTHEEVNRLVEVCSDTTTSDETIELYGDATLLILCTGLRIGEAMALKWENFDETKRTLHVCGNVVEYMEHKNGKAKSVCELIPSTKTRSGDRYVPLNEQSYQLLKKIAIKQKEMPSSFIIANKKGMMNSPNVYRKAYRKITALADIQGTTPHSLRHTFASRLFESGTEVKIVSELLGHRSVDVTYNTYIHVIKSLKENTVNNVDFLSYKIS